MIFKQWEQVIGRKQPLKTQTRRPVHEDDVSVQDDLRGGIMCVLRIQGGFRKRTISRVGAEYAVQRPDKKSVGRIRITRIRRERLDAIVRNDADCFAEGIGPGVWENMDGWVCPECGNWFWAPYRAFRCLWQHIYAKTDHRWLEGYTAGDVAARLPDVWPLDFELVEVSSG